MPQVNLAVALQVSGADVHWSGPAPGDCGCSPLALGRKSSKRQESA